MQICVVIVSMKKYTAYGYFNLLTWSLSMFRAKPYESVFCYAYYHKHMKQNNTLFTTPLVKLVPMKK